MIVSNRKKELLSINKDTHSRIIIPEFEELLQLENFEKIYEKEYSKYETCTYDKDENGNWQSLSYERKSTLFVWWNYEFNILVYGTSYPSLKVENDQLIVKPSIINSASMKYTLQYKEKRVDNVLSSCSSGEKPNTIVGNHDIREGFRSKLNALKEHYEFIEWQGEQNLWLLHYSQYGKDDNGQEIEYSSDIINQQVFEQFPEKVKNVMSDKWYGAISTIEKIKFKILTIVFGWNMSLNESEKEEFLKHMNHI